MIYVPIRLGSIEKTRIAVEDVEGRPISGLSPTIVLENLSTGRFFNGLSFVEVSVFKLFLQVRGGNSHYSGLYEFTWDVEGGLAEGHRVEYSINALGFILERGRYVIRGEVSKGLARRRFPKRRKIPEYNPFSKYLR